MHTSITTAEAEQNYLGAEANLKREQAALDALRTEIRARMGRGEDVADLLTQQHLLVTKVEGRRQIAELAFADYIKEASKPELAAPTPPVRFDAEAVFEWHKRDLDSDLVRNRETGEYVPSAKVLGTREEGRQEDEIKRIGKEVRGDYWQEWAYERPSGTLQVGFHDNRAGAGYDIAMKRLGEALAAAGYTLQNGGFVRVDTSLVKSMIARHGDWVELMRQRGAKIPDYSDEAISARIAARYPAAATRNEPPDTTLAREALASVTGINEATRQALRAASGPVVRADPLPEGHYSYRIIGTGGTKTYKDVSASDFIASVEAMGFRLVGRTGEVSPMLMNQPIIHGLNGPFADAGWVRYETEAALEKRTGRKTLGVDVDGSEPPQF